MKFCLCVLGLNMLHHATFCAVPNSDDFVEEVRHSDIGPTFFASYSVDLLRSVKDYKKKYFQRN